MRRSFTVPTAILTVVILIAGCTSSDDTAEETTTTAPAATVAPPETVTTAAAVTSTTLSEAAAITTVEALQEALNAYDSDAAIALIADGGSVLGATPGNPQWEKEFAEREAWGHQGTLSDCETTDGVLTCLETWERTKFGGQAGIIRVSEWEFRFDDQGLIRSTYTKKNVSGGPESFTFDRALGVWMATAHPEAYETFYVEDSGHIHKENCMNRIDELSPLIDEFVAQSDEYPLRETATADSSSDDFNEMYVGNWKSNQGFYEQYREDGTYSIGRNLAGVESNPIEVGTYEFDGETLRIRAFDDSEFCAGIEAVYRAEFSESGTVVIHTRVTDDCPERAAGGEVPIRKLP